MEQSAAVVAYKKNPGEMDTPCLTEFTSDGGQERGNIWDSGAN